MLNVGEAARGCLVEKVGPDLSIPALVKAMLRSEEE